MSEFRPTPPTLLRAAITGVYPESSSFELAQSDALIAQSFGTRERNGSPGKVNEELAMRANTLAMMYDLPIIAQEEVDDVLADEVAMIRISGEASASDGSGLDSWGMLLQARNLLGGVERPLIVAQAHHIGRVAAQAVKLGMEPHLPAGMPREFAPDSEQWWTRSRRLWVARELPGMGVLKLQGKL